MSNALSYICTGNELAQRRGSGLGPELDPDLALPGFADADGDARQPYALNPSAFLHHAMQSTRTMLALSTVARLIMDKERREGAQNTVAPSEDTRQSRCETPFFSTLCPRHPTDSTTAHLQYRIQELEVSLKRIAASDLPEVTKDIVRLRMLEQMALLRACSDASHATATE